jgi:hypothetical protein
VLTRFNWCTQVAFSLDTQLVVSKTDLMLRILVRSVPLAGSEPKRQLPGTLGQPNDGVTVNKS